MTMVAFGAELVLVPSVDGRITPDLVPRMIDKARELAAAGNTYWTDQLQNRDTLKGYEGIGQELLAQVDGPLDAFCGGVGTAGMLIGVARALRAAGSPARIVALEPATSAVISIGRAGTHRIEGVGIGFLPPHLDRSLIDDARGIDEQEARETARRLAREEGVFAGISSGMNVVGALQLARELGPGHTPWRPWPWTPD